jgi:hypothetical protein
MIGTSELATDTDGPRSRANLASQAAKIKRRKAV